MIPKPRSNGAGTILATKAITDARCAVHVEGGADAPQIEKVKVRS
jgi:hypothetical protein